MVGTAAAADAALEVLAAAAAWRASVGACAAGSSAAGTASSAGSACREGREAPGRPCRPLSRLALAACMMVEHFVSVALDMLLGSLDRPSCSAGMSVVQGIHPWNYHPEVP